MKQHLIALGLFLPFIACTVKKPAPSLPPFRPSTNAELLAEIRKLNLDVQETPRGLIVTLPGIFFGFNSADLEPEGREKVEALAKILNHPRAVQRKVTIEGHADALGSQTYNLKLSQERAEAVEQAMISAQMQKDRLYAEGFGETRPIAPNMNPDGSDNLEGRAQNRRVEVIIQDQEIEALMRSE